MKFQISLRSSLIATALIGMILAWYAHNAAVRASELQAIQRLRSLTKYGVSISHSTDPGTNWCGTIDYRGCEITTEPCATFLFN